MQKIAICDDESSALTQLSNYIAQYQSLCQDTLFVETYTSAESLLSQFHHQFDIIFLDIEIKESNGINLAKTLRSLGCDAILIFVTQYLQFATEGYKVNAFRYLLKPISYHSFQNELSGAIAQAKMRKKEITILTEHHTWQKVTSSHIFSAEIFQRNTILYLESSEIHTLEPLKSIYSKLEPIGFIKIYKNSIVNPEKITSYTNSQVTLSNGRTIPISRHRYAEFKKKYMQYWEKLL